MKQKYGFEEYDNPNSLMSKKVEKVIRCFSSFDNHGGLSLLDVGCGNGEFIFRSKDLFSSIVGLELDKELFKFCVKRFNSRKNVNILPIGVDDLFLFDEKFDCITALDVIEHVDNPLDALVAIREKLNEGGIFIFTSPNWMDYFWRIFGKNPQHKTIHSSYGWARLIEKAGFKVISVDAVKKPFGHHLLGLCVIIVATLLPKSLNNGECL